MLGGSCSPCCGVATCWTSVVVRLSDSIVFERLLGNRSAWSRTPANTFYLLDTFTTATGGEFLACGYAATFSAAYEPCDIIFDDRDAYVLSIPRTAFTISVGISRITAGASSVLFSGTITERDLPCVGTQKDVLRIDGILQPYVEHGMIGSNIEYWTLDRWTAARDDSGDTSVPSDAVLVTQSTTKNPWDFTSTSGPSEYVVTLSDFSITDGRVGVLQGAYSLPYPRVRLSVSRSSVQEISIPRFSTVSKSSSLGGSLSLHWRYHGATGSILNVGASLQLTEYEQPGGGYMLRRTELAMAQVATNRPTGVRAPPAGVLSNESATLSVYESYFPFRETPELVGTCKAAVTYEP